MLGLASWYLEQRVLDLWKRLVRVQLDVWVRFTEWWQRQQASVINEARRKATTALHGGQQ